MSLRSVVLLRGVNAGAARRVPQDAFANVLRDLGGTDVTVVINSGNALGRFPTSVTARQMQDALQGVFAFEIPTLLLPGADAVRIAEAIPAEWRSDALTPERTGRKSDVAYLFAEVDQPEIVDQLGYRPELETLRYVPGAVLSTVSRRDQPRSSLQRVVGKALYQHLTVRSVHTSRKLAALVDDHTAAAR